MTPVEKQRVSGATVACRCLCSALVAAPLLYWGLVRQGNAYLFLALVLLSPIAGFVLLGNSLLVLARHRDGKSASFTLVSVLLSVIAVLTAWYFLPQFRM